MSAFVNSQSTVIRVSLWMKLCAFLPKNNWDLFNFVGFWGSHFGNIFSAAYQSFSFSLSHLFSDDLRDLRYMCKYNVQLQLDGEAPTPNCGYTVY